MTVKAQEFSSVEAVRLPAVPLHLAIGIFDGVHLGHRAVIEAAVHSARRSGGLAAVLTFHPHPSVLFHPASPTRLILPAETRTRLLLGLWVDAVITQPFTPEFARIEAGNFLPWLRQRLPHLSAVYVGQNFRFGARRLGDVAMLVESARQAGLSLFSAPPVNYDGKAISSTRIRGLLEEGDIAAANALLGYTYFAEGRVVPGRKLGRTIGFPTLNLAWNPGLRPRYGVYVVRVSRRSEPVSESGTKEGGAEPLSIPGAANYGLRPTVEQTSEPLLESFLFGACPFDAGDEIKVEWLRFLRPELKFSGVEELRVQIAKDIEAAQAAGS